MSSNPSELPTSLDEAQSCGALSAVDAPTRLSWVAIIGYSSGSAGMGAFSTVPGLLLLFFMTEVVGIAPAVAGLAILIAKGASILTDPIAGLLCEGVKTRWGRRLPYLLMGGLMMAAGNAVLFAPPATWAVTDQFAFIFAAYLFATLGASLFEVPYATLPAEMAPDTQVRTWIVTIRSAFVLIGVLAGATCVPWLVNLFGGGRAGYASMSVALGTIILATTLITFATVRTIQLKESPLTGKFGGWIALRNCIRHRPFLWPMLANCCQVAALSLNFALVPYLAVIILGGSEASAGTMLTGVILVAIASMPVWAKVGLRLGHPLAHAIGGGAFAIGGCLLALGAMQADETFKYSGIAMMGIGFGAIQLSPYAMLAEVTNAFGRTDNGAGREAMLTGLWTASEKLALALGPFLAGLSLDLGGHSSTSNGTEAWPILLGLSLLPCGLIVLSWAPLFCASISFRNAPKESSP